jgi:hypothetical protein
MTTPDVAFGIREDVLSKAMTKLHKEKREKFKGTLIAGDEEPYTIDWDIQASPQFILASQEKGTFQILLNAVHITTEELGKITSPAILNASASAELDDQKAVRLTVQSIEVSSTSKEVKFIVDNFVKPKIKDFMNDHVLKGIQLPKPLELIDIDLENAQVKILDKKYMVVMSCLKPWSLPLSEELVCDCTDEDIFLSLSDNAKKAAIEKHLSLPKNDLAGSIAFDIGDTPESVELNASCTWKEAVLSNLKVQDSKAPELKGVTLAEAQFSGKGAFHLASPTEAPLQVLDGTFNIKAPWVAALTLAVNDQDNGLSVTMGPPFGLPGWDLGIFQKRNRRAEMTISQTPGTVPEQLEKDVNKKLGFELAAVPVVSVHSLDARLNIQPEHLKLAEAEKEGLVLVQGQAKIVQLPQAKQVAHSSPQFYQANRAPEGQQETKFPFKLW